MVLWALGRVLAPMERFCCVLGEALVVLVRGCQMESFASVLSVILGR